MINGGGLMKKAFLVLTMMFLSVSLYAIEVSFGASLRYLGMGIIRGDDANLLGDTLVDFGLDEIDPVSFFHGGQLDMMVELAPYFAFETGIGYSVSTFAFEGRTIGGVKAEVIFKREEVTIPFLLRLQVETRNQVYYAAAGVRLGIPVTENYAEVNASLFGKSQSIDVLDSEFALDVSFALGVENRLIGSHYLGARMGYDMNVISPFDNKEMDDFYHDDFYGSLTYRYAFNSKWNEPKPKSTTKKLDTNII